MASRKLKQLGRYRIEGELGRGAMGVVYRARDPVLDRPVALKTIALDDSVEDREVYEKRFFQEAKAAARLNHPALITIYDFGEQDALAYMALELLDGTELAVRMDQEPPTLAEAVTVALQVAEGLAFAHDSGVVHRDIKPSNIMLLARGRVKIMDFGIARFKQSEMATQIGTRLGTPKYMSPEQVGGGALDHRSDIFSLGTVLYEMLTRSQLFHGRDLAEVMHKVTSFDPPPPSRLNPEVPALLDLVVRRALAKKPAGRYASAWEMADDLRKVQQELAAAWVAPEPAVDVSGDKTLVIAPGADGQLPLRRLTAEGQDSRLSLARRFDSSAAVSAVQLATPRDRQRLGRAPRAPGWWHRLRHDADLARLLLTLALAAGMAALVILS